jgi:uncharacterized protein (DUF2062 family)
VIGVRAATVLAELLALAVVPSLVIPLLSPAIGQSYSLVDTLVHSVCLFVAGSMFFSLAFLLSTVFSDLWRPLLITCAIAVCAAVAEGVLMRDVPFGMVRLMTGERYLATACRGWACLPARPCRRRCCTPRRETSRAWISDVQRQP